MLSACWPILLALAWHILMVVGLEDPLEMLNIQYSLEQYHMYRGEFPCYEHNVSGPHDLLHFGFWLCNPNPEAVWLSESERFITARIDSEQEVILPLPFLRDTQCLKSSLFHTRGSDFTLGGHCCSYLPLRTRCTWLDVTNVTLPYSFELHLSVAGQSNSSVAITDPELELNKRSLLPPLAAPISFLMIFLLCLTRIQLLKKEAEKRAPRVAL